MADRSALKARRKALVREMRHAGAILQGTIVESFTTCGNPRCRCARGQKHGPNYYLSTKEQRRTQMFYIPRGRLAEVRTAVENYRKLKEAVREIVSINRELFRLGEEVK